MKKAKGMDLTEGSVIKTLLAFAFPIMLSNILQSAYNIVDMAIVGQYVGKVGLSAVSIGTDVIHLVHLGSNGLFNGAQVLIAQHTGAKNDKAVSRCIGTLFTTFAIISLALTILMPLFHRPILRFMNTDSTVWDEAAAYVIICCFGQVFHFGYGLIGALLRGKGDSKHPLVFVAIADIVNVFLDLLFVAVFQWGAAGAALATIIGQALAFFWGMHFLIKNKEWFGFDFKLVSFRPDWIYQKQFLKLGLPMSLQSVLVSFATIYVNSFVNSYGVAVSAISGVGTKLGSLAQIITNSLVRGGAAMVGQNIAAGKIERVKKIFIYNFAIAFTYAVVLSAITALFPKVIVGLFTSDQDVLKLIPAYLPIIVLKYFAFASRSPAVALINGIGKPKFNLAIGLVDGIVARVGLSLFMGKLLNMGLYGFWYGGALGGFVPFIVGLVYFLSGKWKTEKILIKED